MAGDLVTYAKDIEAAREAVRKAKEAHSKGGSVKAVNAADRALADANHAYWMCSAGLAQDR